MNIALKLQFRSILLLGLPFALGLASLVPLVSAQTPPPAPQAPPGQRIRPDLSGVDLSDSGKSSNQSSGASYATPPPPPPPAPPQPPSGKRVHADLSGFDLSGASKSVNQFSGSSRGADSPVLLAPQSGKSFSTHPEFHWHMADPGQKILFKLSTLDGTPLWEAETADDHLKYPADAPALTPGSRYLWTIAPDKENLGGRSPPAIIVIIGGAEREKIEEELKAASGDSAQAQVFLDYRIWYDTIERYSSILALRPDDQMARMMRAEVYDQLPATKSLAEADWRMVH